MRKLRQIMLKDDGLDMFGGDLLGAICLIEENHHLLILMIDLEAVVEHLNMEYATLANSLLLVLRNYNVWRQV